MVEENRIEEKKVIAIDKSMYKVEDGKVVIESEALANAIQNNVLDLFVDEEAGLMSDPNSLCDYLACW